MSRDLDKEPYTPEEQRAADYIDQASHGIVGAGDDPIGYLIASHALLVAARQTKPDEVAPGDVVQLDPYKTENKAFGACFMIVSEVKSWGVMGYVNALGTRETTGGQAWYRAEWGTFKKIGRAEWVAKDTIGEDEIKPN